MLKKIRGFIDKRPAGWVLFMLTISVICTVLCFSGVIVSFVYSSSFVDGLIGALFPMFLAAINVVAVVANVERLSQIPKK